MSEFRFAGTETLAHQHRSARRERLPKEWRRKSTHLLGALAPAVVALVGFWGAIGFGLVYLAVYMLAQYRYNHGGTLLHLERVVASIRRKNEVYRTSPYLIAVIVVGVLFELVHLRPLAYAAVGVLALHDGLATIIGLAVGRHVYLYNRSKTLEGTLGAAAIAIPAVIVLGYLGCVQTGLEFGTEMLLAIICGAWVAIAVETLPLRNDNIPVLVTAAITMIGIYSCLTAGSFI